MPNFEGTNATLKELAEAEVAISTALIAEAGAELGFNAPLDAAATVAQKAALVSIPIIEATAIAQATARAVSAKAVATILSLAKANVAASAISGKI